MFLSKMNESVVTQFPVHNLMIFLIYNEVFTLVV